MIAKHHTLPLSRVAVLLCLLLAFSQCKKGDPIDNQAPETFTSVEAINLSGENRLNSVIELQWWGTDPDGVVAGFEISFDQEIWTFTPNQDSTFKFSIDAGSDTVDIDFWVRALDDDGVVDPTPAYLKIPLKNTPPEIAFDRDLLPTDTAFNVLTLTWEASDLDGFETIANIQLKANDGDWVDLQYTKTLVAIVPDDPKSNGTSPSKIYFDVDDVGPSLGGLNVNGMNDIYIRAVDIAGSSSQVDTLAGIYFRGKTHDILITGAHDKCPTNFYPSYLAALGLNADFINMERESAKNQPRIWNPTFALMLLQYESVIMYASDVKYTNAQTNEANLLIELASSSIQTFVDAGGKLLISSSFANDMDPNSALFGILPVDSLSSSVGFARLPTDSLAVGLESGYPDLISGEFITLDPIYPSSDAIPIYSANLTPVNNWTGPNTVGVKRRLNGKTNFIFTSLELHRVDKDESAVQSFFDHVFNSEFGW